MKKQNLLLHLAASSIALVGFVAYVGAAEKVVSEIQTTETSGKGLGYLERANKVIGKAVYSSDNQKVGKLENLVVDLESGRILYAVIGAGPLGIGGHDYAVAPGVFSDARGDNVRLKIEKGKLTAAPQFSSNVDKPEQLAQANFVNQVYQYFGQTAWWQGNNTSADAGSFRNVHKANDVIGMKVKNVANEDLGKIENLMVELPAGRVAYAILNPDSDLKLGNNYYALPPNALTLSSDQKYLVSDLNRDKLAAAPHFAREQWQDLSDPAYGSKVYQYYGKQPYFESGTKLQPTGRDSEKIYRNK